VVSTDYNPEATILGVARALKVGKINGGEGVTASLSKGLVRPKFQVVEGTPSSSAASVLPRTEKVEREPPLGDSILPTPKRRKESDPDATDAADNDANANLGMAGLLAGYGVPDE